MPPRSQGLIYENALWTVSHRANSALPGYLIVSPRSGAMTLNDMSPEELASMGPILAATQRAIETALRPVRIYIGRYGHMTGHPFHFHVIPIYQWVERLFWANSRYRQLQAFGTDAPDDATDGAELTFFVWREFCERPDPPAIEGPDVLKAIEILLESFSAS